MKTENTSAKALRELMDTGVLATPPERDRAGEGGEGGGGEQDESQVTVWDAARKALPFLGLEFVFSLNIGWLNFVMGQNQNTQENHSATLREPRDKLIRNKEVRWRRGCIWGTSGGEIPAWAVAALWKSAPMHLSQIKDSSA